MCSDMRLPSWPPGSSELCILSSYLEVERVEKKVASQCIEKQHIPIAVQQYISLDWNKLPWWKRKNRFHYIQHVSWCFLIFRLQPHSSFHFTRFRHQIRYDNYEDAWSYYHFSWPFRRKRRQLDMCSTDRYSVHWVWKLLTLLQFNRVCKTVSANRTTKLCIKLNDRTVEKQILYGGALRKANI